MKHSKRTKAEIEATIGPALKVASLHWADYWENPKHTFAYSKPSTTAIMTLNLLEADLRAYRLLREAENAGNPRSARGERAV